MFLKEIESIKNIFILIFKYDIKKNIKIEASEDCKEFIGKDIVEIVTPEKFIFYREPVTIKFENNKSITVNITEETATHLEAVLEAEEWLKYTQESLRNRLKRNLTYIELQQLLELTFIRKECARGNYDCTRFCVDVTDWEQKLKLE